MELQSRSLAAGSAGVGNAGFAFAVGSGGGFAFATCGLRGFVGFGVGHDD